MRGIWLAVLLGIILGSGLAFIPAPSAPREPMLLGQNEAQTTYKTEVKAHQETSLDLQFALWSILAGIVVAVPFFLVAKRRTS